MSEEQTTTIRVQLFAVARQLAGSDAVTVELPANATVDDLRSALAFSTPALADLARQVAIAVNSEYAGDEMLIPKGAAVAVIPPVSGG